jgi:hypothetical protein
MSLMAVDGFWREKEKKENQRTSWKCKCEIKIIKIVLNGSWDITENPKVKKIFQNSLINYFFLKINS